MFVSRLAETGHLPSHYIMCKYFVIIACKHVNIYVIECQPSVKFLTLFLTNLKQALDRLGTPMADNRKI